MMGRGRGTINFEPLFNPKTIYSSHETKHFIDTINDAQLDRRSTQQAGYISQNASGETLGRRLRLHVKMICHFFATGLVILKVDYI